MPTKYALMRLTGRPELWLALLLLWQTVSALRAWHTPWQQDALTEWVRWATGMGLALALGTLLTDVRRAAWLFAAMAGILAVLGLSQAARGMTEVSGPFGDHQIYGSALLAVLPLALALSVCSRTALSRGAVQGIVLASVVALAFSQTRSAWVGAAVGMVVFAVLWLWTVRPPRRALLLPALLGLGILGAFAVLLTATQLQKPLVLRMQTLRSFSTDTDWQARLIAWQGARRMAAQSPWTGAGLGQYPARQRAFTHFGRALGPAQRPSLSEQAHDFYLQTAAEIGGVGVGLYGLALAAVAGCAFVRLRARRGGPVGIRTVVIIATVSLLVAHLVDALANPSWQFAEVSLLFWGALGVGLAAIHRPEEAWSAFTPRLRALRLVTGSGLAAAAAAPLLHWGGLLPPVEAYAGGTGLTLSSVTLTPSPLRVSLRGAGAQIAFSAIGHFRITQSGQPAPDETMTWNGPGAADGAHGTRFVARGAWEAPVGVTGFSVDPAERNVLTIDPREGIKAGRVVTVRVVCFVKDDQNERGRIVASAPVSVICYP